ncbi:MAG: alanine/glycine:cation symporter family protein, partial [Aurantibacter sp.]
HGGPMYYLSRGLKEKGFTGLGKVLAVIFAVLCVGASFGGGNAFQSNQAAVQLTTMLNLEGGAIGLIIGTILAVLVGIVIIGGIKKIASVTEKIVPFMAGIYVLASLVIIFANFEYIGNAFGMIFAGAFTPEAGLGGVLGVIIVGFQRAAFSNEAGAGSAAIAHSAVKTKYPASEGVVALLEPFIDTVVICTMTALVIIFFNMDAGAFDYGNAVGSTVLLNDTGAYVGGVDLTSMAYDSVIPGFRYVLTVAIILFAFSTMISWSYYGLQSWKYLFGRSKGADTVYKLLFLVFVIIGAAATLDAVIKFSDAMILALVFPNMIGLLFLFPRVKDEFDKYLDAIKTVGK